MVEAGQSLAAGPLDTPGLARSIVAAASTAIGLDSGALNAALGRLRAQSPDLAQAVEAELAQILSPRQQGELARIFLAQETGADLIPDRGAGQPAPAADPTAAEPFITFNPGGVDHQTYVENLSRAPAGSEQAREYQALVRHAGTTDPVAIALVVGEVATNGVTNREAFARTGPLTGAELRYRIGADFAQIAAQARAEIVTLSDEIRNAEANGATPADTAELRGLLQQSLNHFALVSENPGALRESGLVSDPIFSANLAVAEAYRSGADALAARSVPGADGAYSTVEAATRMRAVIGPEAYDRYIDGAISVSSLPFIPADVTASADIRTNIVRQLGAGFFRHEIDVGGRFDTSLLGTGGTMTPERFTWQNTNLVMRQAMMERVGRADRQVLEWGRTASIGRELYTAILSEGAGGLAGVFIAGGSRLIQRPVTRAVDEVVDLATPTVSRAGTEVLDSAVPALRTTDPVRVSGTRPIDLAQSYEVGIQGRYGEAGLVGREFEVIVDGELRSRFADAVTVQNGLATAVDAKFVDNWSSSLRNPNSRYGDAAWATREQEQMLIQARTYVANFPGGAIYHTNSTELAAHYDAIFKANGIDNITFVITPAGR